MVLTEEKQKILRDLYYNSGFKSKGRLYDKTRENPDQKISRRDVNEYVDKQSIYQRMQKIDTKNYNSYVPPAPHFNYEADLVDYSKFSRYNSGYKYILNVIDTFTKKVSSHSLKTKKSNEIIPAFEKCINELGIPLQLHTDIGSEFISKEFEKKILDTYGIKGLYTRHHAFFIERYNRTQKEMIEKYFQTRKTKKWIDVYKKFMDEYNNTKHSTTELKPNEIDESNKHIALWMIASKARRKNKLKALSVGDKVRFRVNKSKLEKGYTPNFSKEIEEIEKIDGRYYFITNHREPFLRNDLFLVKGGISESYES